MWRSRWADIKCGSSEIVFFAFRVKSNISLSKIFEKQSHSNKKVLEGKLRQGDVDILLAARQPAECATPGGDVTQSPAEGPAQASAPPTPSALPYAWVRIEMGGTLTCLARENTL